MSTRPIREFVGSQDGLLKKPVLRFRIYADNDKRKSFVDVHLWQHLHQLRSMWRGKKRRGSKIVGMFLHWKDERGTPDAIGRKVSSAMIGEIHLALPSLTYNTIAHECYHAAREYARRRRHIEPATCEENDSRVKLSTDAEELNAIFAGYLTDRVVHACKPHADEWARKRQEAKERRESRAARRSQQI